MMSGGVLVEVTPPDLDSATKGRKVLAAMEWSLNFADKKYIPKCINSGPENYSEYHKYRPAVVARMDSIKKWLALADESVTKTLEADALLKGFTDDDAQKYYNLLKGLEAPLGTLVSNTSIPTASYLSEDERYKYTGFLNAKNQWLPATNREVIDIFYNAFFNSEYAGKYRASCILDKGNQELCSYLGSALRAYTKWASKMLGADEPFDDKWFELESPDILHQKRIAIIDRLLSENAARDAERQRSASIKKSEELAIMTAKVKGLERQYGAASIFKWPAQLSSFISKVRSGEINQQYEGDLLILRSDDLNYSVRQVAGDFVLCLSRSNLESLPILILGVSDAVEGRELISISNNFIYVGIRNYESRLNPSAQAIVLKVVGG